MYYLLIATIFWGTTFVVQKTAAPYIDPFFYNGVRFFVGGIVMCVISKILKKVVSLAEVKSGLILGVVLAISINTQQIGIAETTAGKAGFITSLYLLFVPIILSILGHHVRIIEVFSLILSLVGFYYLSEINIDSLNHGDFLILLCAVFFSFHVLLVSKYSRNYDPVTLSAIQFLSCGAISLFVAFIMGGIKLEPLVITWFEIMYGCVFSVLIAYTFQFLGQRQTPPTVASFIMSLEGIVSFFAGMVFLSESYNYLQYLGASLIFFATLLVVLPENKAANK